MMTFAKGFSMRYYMTLRYLEYVFLLCQYLFQTVSFFPLSLPLFSLEHSTKEDWSVLWFNCLFHLLSFAVNDAFQRGINMILICSKYMPVLCHYLFQAVYFPPLSPSVLPGAFDCLFSPSFFCCEWWVLLGPSARLLAWAMNMQTRNEDFFYFFLDRQGEYVTMNISCMHLWKLFLAIIICVLAQWRK